jgi:hypothetical protein
MVNERAIKLAIELQKLGVSQLGCTRLLVEHSFEEIERQLEYLPYRKASRPEALIVEAIRHNYSPPKEFFHAPIDA